VSGCSGTSSGPVLPIYGDSAAKIFDAQSTARVYLRIDKQKSWLLYGDFTTDAGDNIRQLSKVSRALTGPKLHYENAHVSANVYASQDSSCSRCWSSRPMEPPGRIN